MRERFSQINTASDIRSLLLFSDLNCDAPEQLRKRILTGFEVKLVKQNSKRKIYCLQEPDGRTMYLKLFARQNFPLSLFRFYASKEYRIARSLEKHGLPVIRYLAWGRLKKGGFCLSEGVSEALSLRQYFFETLVSDAGKRNDFLEHLAEVILALLRKNVFHPDFHLGNILYSCSENRIYLADPWGMHENWFGGVFLRRALCLPWLELRGSISDDELLNGIQSSGLAASKIEALELLESVSMRHFRRQRRHWKKLAHRILSGKSKFSTAVQLPEGLCYFRHTLWYVPPEKLELNPLWRRVEYTSIAGSVAPWLHSFLKIPPVQNPPLARLICPNGHSVLFYAE